LISKILDFSKIEAGALTLDKKLFNLWDCAESIVASMKYKAQEKLVSLTLTISPNVPKQIIGDSTRFSQVLVNLTSNAIKFTEVHGSVDISIYVEEENPHMLLVSVKDTGIGIPASGIDLLFKHFSQIDNSSSRRFDGTGLGLAISKRIAEIMGGTITVHSTEGEGSTFTFSCIIDTQDDEQEVCLLPPVEKQFLPSNYKILVAEDNPINQHIMQRMLTRIGFTDIVIANNGEEAFEAYERQPYDWKLILMDNFMPKQDGLTCTRLIRELEKELGKDPVTIIAVTASATRTQQQECYAAGMNEFITKPVVMSTLKELLAKACTKC
jgi:CheY-like chemotaxis protein